MKRRIGIYSGSFDPAHNGHIGFAVRALDMASLDEVVFIPEKHPRGKMGVTDMSHRFELLVRATSPYEGLSVRLLHAEQFDVRTTMPELRAMFGDAELYLLMGSDVAWTFSDRWVDLNDLFAQVGLIIGLRSDDTRRELKKMLKSLDVTVHPRYIFVDSPMADASSTRVRRGTVERDVTPEVRG
jgi:nicotinate-nucleotide adenylyltransferase